VPLTVKEDSHLQDSPSPLATPLSSLRSGVLSIRSSAAACDGVLIGFVPFASARLGCAEVWGSGPSLWLPVAEALGFTVRLAVYSDRAWRDCMASFYSTTRFLRQLLRARDRDASPQIPISGRQTTWSLAWRSYKKKGDSIKWKSSCSPIIPLLRACSSRDTLHPKS
jgi:hypothetical protein